MILDWNRFEMYQKSLQIDEKEQKKKQVEKDEEKSTKNQLVSTLIRLFYISKKKCLFDYIR